jgi:hypothetical protein
MSATTRSPSPIPIGSASFEFLQEHRQLLQRHRQERCQLPEEQLHVDRADRDQRGGDLCDRRFIWRQSWADTQSRNNSRYHVVFQSIGPMPSLASIGGNPGYYVAYVAASARWAVGLRLCRGHRVLLVCYRQGWVLRSRQSQSQCSRTRCTMSAILSVVPSLAPARRWRDLSRRSCAFVDIGGAPDTIRTCDLHLRRATLNDRLK